MSLFIVYMDSSYVRDAQYLNTSGLSDEEFEQCMNNPGEYENWSDIEPAVYIDMVNAESEEEARRIAGEKNDCDFRILSAMEINKKIRRTKNGLQHEHERQ